MAAWNVPVRSREAVEGVAHVAGPFDGLAFLGGVLQAVEEQDRVAAPDRLVAADMLDVQAGVAAGRPPLAEIAVAPPRTAESPCENTISGTGPFRAAPAGQ